VTAPVTGPTVDRTVTVTRRDVMIAGAALIVVVILGLTRLADPFHGDQSLFLQYGEALARGESLYVDRWDQKQPGVFIFYGLAATVFGASEIGVHLFELAYLLVFGVGLVLALRGWLRARWLAMLAPVVVIGTYYAVTGTWHLTQAEWLVTVPLFAGMWLAAAPWSTRSRRRIALAGAGAAAGILVTFKLVLAPVILVGWALSLWTADRPLTVRDVIADRVAPAAVGGAAVLGVVAAWLAATGSLPDAIWTAFVYPLVAAGELDGPPVTRLARSAAWFALVMAPWILLALAAGVRWRGRRIEWLTIQAIGWIVTGLIVIVIQRYSWWEYHFTLLFAPVALLALRGADGLIALTRGRRAVAASLGVALLVVPLAIGGIRVALAGFAPLTILAVAGDPSAVLTYQRAAREAYDEVWEDTRFLREPDARPGPVYVFGNALYVGLGERTQAIPIHGFSWELSVASQWATLADELAAAAPPYVFVDDDVAPLIAARSPATVRLLEDAYSVLRAGRDGDWYQRD
jgi:hypothetical protein